MQPKNQYFVASLVTAVNEAHKYDTEIQKTPEKQKFRDVQRIVTIRQSFEGKHYTTPSFSTGKKEVTERLKKLRNFPELVIHLSKQMYDISVYRKSLLAH